jgi:enediyne biosynthesis protein E4
MRYLYIVITIILISSCKDEGNELKLFSLVNSLDSGLESRNDIQHTENFNVFSYRNFFNGAGVAIGDVNNDGLADVYLTNNMTANKLFINQGDFKFKDISEKSGTVGTKKWSTGVVMVDINYDGLLDIYVCNAGYEKGIDQENELFINNGDLTFTEKAKDYNLNNNGYTTHAAFFDYDLDGDLDVYILNNSFIPVNTLNYSNRRELMAMDWPVRDFLKGGGDQLLRNDGDTFIDVTEEAGIYSSLIGFGLGVTVGDINNDNYPDIYVSNDFFERDYLYINQRDGTFREDIKNQMQHISLASMGADMADINNDGYPEVFVTEMLPTDDYRVKTITSFEQYNVFELKLKRDFYYQYMHNTLQLNNHNSTFSEISWFGGVSASDWSWGALMFDANNDGFRDIYVSNGIPRDVTDQDFINFFASDVIRKMALTGEKEEINTIIDKMPSTPILNKFFVNQGDLTFQDEAIKSGFNLPSFSNGSAYGDLDNDGDLDLIVNNTNQEVFLYKNNCDSLLDNHFISVQLIGSGKNTHAIGSKILVYANNQIFNSELIPSRGFQSSVDYKIVLGLGKTSKIDSLVVHWFDNTNTVLYNVSTDALIKIEYTKSIKTNKPLSPVNIQQPYFQEYEVPFVKHEEDDFVDFYKEGLIIKMLSREGPKAANGDVNGDGLTDVFIGGARYQAGKLYIATGNGFEEKNIDILTADRVYEDTAAEFLDIDGDGDLDLFVGSGGNNAPARSRLLQDRVYINDGRGNFTKSPRTLPINGFNTSVAVPVDFDQDGDIDIFVGSRSVPNVYGISPPSFLYENNGSGTFRYARAQNDPDFTNLGMVTDAKLVDVNGDNNPELIVVGEWEYPKIFTISSAQFQLLNSNLKAYSGWWYAIENDDVDNDGDQDLILGNRGENFYFSGSFNNPAKLWLSDFDKNGIMEKIITQSIDGKDMPVAMKNELTSQISSLKTQNLSHVDYAGKAIQDLFSKEVLAKAQLKTANYFKSAVAINNGHGDFTMVELPKEVQFSCVYDITCIDLNGDSYKDLILGGNDYGFTPQFSRLDASYGQVLLNDKTGNFSPLDNIESGFFVKGEIKQLVLINNTQKKSLLVLINNQKPKMFKITNN